MYSSAGIRPLALAVAAERHSSNSNQESSNFIELYYILAPDRIRE